MSSLFLSVRGSTFLEPVSDVGVRPPSVDSLARSISDIDLPNPLLIDASRAAIAAGNPASARERAEEIARSLLVEVVNATGVLLHTNLGRAPMAFTRRARPTNLELDLATGRRARRRGPLGHLLAASAAADAALVVNNGASAILLVLSTLALGRTVIVSRGELVEIGGGFRVPEVLAASGAHLVEVGTTNRTRLADYRAAVSSASDAALVLKVHPSNYRIVGFTESVPVAALMGLGLPVVADIGSGLIDADAPWLSGGPPGWLSGEPAARQTLAAGAAVVTFSGDKLFGGPQAGIVAGRRDLVDACAQNPLYRALRPGSLVLEALQETALAYLRRDGRAIPFWRMATTPLSELEHRAQAIASISGARVTTCMSVAGGGSLPGHELSSCGLALDGDRSAELRQHKPPIVARVRDGSTICDLRTVEPDDDESLAHALAGVIGTRGGGGSSSPPPGAPKG